MTMVWIVEDDEAKRVALVGFLKHRGYQVADFTDAEEALAQLEREQPRVIITDLKLPGRDGLELLKDVKSKAPGLPVVIMTAYGTVDTAVEAMKLGAYDYLVKPIDLKEVLSVIRRIEELEQPFDQKEELEESGLPSLVGKSESMQVIYDLIKKVAPTNATVLIQGESGTGKERLAEAIHAPSFSFYEKVKRGKVSFEEAVEEMEREIILLSLKEARGNKARAARILKMKRSTYCDKVRKYRLET